MHKLIGFVILAIAAVFIISAAVGLFNSNLDSRVALLVVLAVVGVALVPIGLGNFRNPGTPAIH